MHKHTHTHTRALLAASTRQWSNATPCTFQAILFGRILQPDDIPEEFRHCTKSLVHVTGQYSLILLHSGSPSTSRQDLWSKFSPGPFVHIRFGGEEHVMEISCDPIPSAVTLRNFRRVTVMCYWCLNFDLAKIIEKAESKPRYSRSVIRCFADWAHMHY